MVEYGAQNSYEAILETGKILKYSGELKSVSNIIKVDLGELCYLRLLFFNNIRDKKF